MRLHYDLDVNYEEYLTTELWRIIRNRVLYRDNYTCGMCKTHIATQVHHKQYDNDTLSGHSMQHLISLCDDCHRLISIDENGDALSLHESNQRLAFYTQNSGEIFMALIKTKLFQHK